MLFVVSDMVAVVDHSSMMRLDDAESLPLLPLAGSGAGGGAGGVGQGGSLNSAADNNSGGSSTSVELETFEGTAGAGGGSAAELQNTPRDRLRRKQPQETAEAEEVEGITYLPPNSLAYRRAVLADRTRPHTFRNSSRHHNAVSHCDGLAAAATYAPQHIAVLGFALQHTPAMFSVSNVITTK